MARVQQGTDCNYLPMATAFELSVPFPSPFISENDQVNSCPHHKREWPGELLCPSLVTGGQSCVSVPAPFPFTFSELGSRRVSHLADLCHSSHRF